MNNIQCWISRMTNKNITYIHFEQPEFVHDSWNWAKGSKIQGLDSISQFDHIKDNECKEYVMVEKVEFDKMKEELNQSEINNNELIERFGNY